MTKLARISLLVLLALAAAQQIAQADYGVCCQPTGCPQPVARTYRISPTFCAAQLAAMIPHCVPGGCSGDCGPYGVPPIFASGNNLVIRQTPEVHDRIGQYLTSMGAYLKPISVNAPR